ncbi:gamma-aminobutyric acid type B receptor subunit 2-like [Pomacea canaliculata]|uniref:gamma-aminobutyric acid type B receptor subunit 2-like n=1 Tax=Pomacea canaliculata TaxID=400727 RepID=UPI000D739967|nr:gamma-aminobutyric acid type B receptor subunit 2-like [Pomacea canaliculata]
MTVISFCGFLIALTFAAINFKHRHLKVIKLSSPTINNWIAVGCALGYLSVVLNGLDGRLLTPQSVSVMCSARLATLSVAYTLAFGAMFSKTWRVHRIMTNKKLDKIKVKDLHLLAWLIVLVTLDLFFLVLWNIINPLRRDTKPLEVQTDPEDPDHLYLPYLEICVCQHKEYWVGALLVYKGLLLLFGIFLAWETRGIKVQALNDSRYIGLCVYNVAVLCVVGVPVNFLINDENHMGSYLITSAFIILAVSITLCIVFLPKLYTVYRNPSGDVDVRFPTQHTVFSVERASGSKVTPLSQMANNIAFQRRLEILISKKDQEIQELKDEIARIQGHVGSALLLNGPTSDTAA